MSDPITILDHAMQPLIDEMFKNGPEEGCRLWEDSSNHLNPAIRILWRAEIELRMPELVKEGTAMLEHHRRLEEKFAT